MDVAPLRAATKADLEKIAEFNRTDATFPNNVTIQQLIEARIDSYSSRTAVICEHDKTFDQSTLTYGQLNEKVNQLANLLRSKGVGPDDIVGIMVERSFAMLIGIFGIIKAGAAYLPISPTNPPDRINYLLNDAVVKVLLVHNRTASRIRFGSELINLDNLEIYQGPTENPPVVNKAEHLAYVIYTSGSTGKPKGVMIEHRSVVNRLNWMQRAYPITDTDVILQKTAYYFDVSVWELFWFAFHGAKLCFLAPGAETMPPLIVQTVKKHQITVAHFVPSMLNLFLEYLDAKRERISQNMASVRQVFASGESLAPSHVKKFNRILGQKTGTRLTNLYGPTEATVDVSYFDCPKHNNFDKIPIGRPIDNTRFYIMHGEQQVGIGEPGELCIAGAGLARGYLNNVDLTREKFLDNPFNPGERIYCTGDTARWLPDGNVEYLGREDSQVKIRGLRIELGEIESAARDFPRVIDCLVNVKHYSESIILIIAYIVCERGLRIDDLKKYLGQQLPDYMVPNHFERIDQVPLGPGGKADRKALPEPVIQVRNSSKHSSPASC
jgi:amino acid adenylation domain-containing protein